MELRVHSYDEIGRKEFWEFVDRAVAGFDTFTEKVQEKSDILQPWKQLGRKWHFARKGFPIGKKIDWDVDVLEDLFELLAEIGRRRTIPLEQQASGAALRARAARALGGRADQEARRRVPAPDGPQGPLHAGTTHRPGLSARVGRRPVRTIDTIRLKFRTPADLARGDLGGFLKEHLAAVRAKRWIGSPRTVATNLRSAPFAASAMLPCERV